MAEKSLNDLPRDLRALYTKGSDAFQRENYDYAIALFNQILEKQPAILDVRKSLRAAQFKKAGGGGGFFKRAFNSASSSPMIAKGQMTVRKNPQEAMQIAEQILNGDPHSAAAHKLLAEAALAMELPLTAVLSLELLVKNSPKDKTLGVQLAEALTLAGEKTRAEGIYSDLIRDHPYDAELNQALKDLSARKTMDEGGYGALEGGQGSYRDILKNKDEAVMLEQEKRQVKSEDTVDRVIREYEERLTKEPNNLKLLRDLAELYTQKKEFDRALSYYEKLSQSDAGNDSSLQSAIAQTKVRQFDHLLSQLDPNAADYAERSAQIKADRLAYQLAECKERAEKFPTDLMIRFELGQLYFQTDNLSEAIKEFQKARQNPHKRVQSLNYLAQCFAKRGMYDMAARQAQEAIKEKQVFDAEKMDLVYTLGSILEKMGKREEAIEQFKLIYEVDSSYKDVEKKVDEYYAGGGGG
jgi:tetratricopeptide (TPR) repeat protein